MKIVLSLISILCIISKQSVKTFLLFFSFFCSLGKTKIHLDMNEINYEMKLKLTMTHGSWAMNILYAVFVTEKPV